MAKYKTKKRSRININEPVVDDIIRQMLTEGAPIKNIANVTGVQSGYVKLIKKRITRQLCIDLNNGGEEEVVTAAVPETTVVTVEEQQPMVENMIIDNQQQQETVDKDSVDLDIAIDYQSGMTIKDISKKYNTYASRIYRVLKKLGIERDRLCHNKFTIVESIVEEKPETAAPIPEEVPVVEEEPVIEAAKSEEAPEVVVKEETEPDNTINYKEIKYKSFYQYLTGLPLTQYIKAKTVTAGLVAGRHDILNSYVQKYIFESFSDAMALNYHRQEQIAEKFIKTNITFDEAGRAKESLVLYLTGSQSALISVIKTCYNHKVNLVVKHWDNYSKVYNPQVVFNQFETDCTHMSIEVLDALSEGSDPDIFITKDISPIENFSGQYFLITLRSKTKLVSGNVIRIVSGVEATAASIFKRIQHRAIDSNASNLELYFDEISIYKNEISYLATKAKMSLN